MTGAPVWACLPVPVCPEVSEGSRVVDPSAVVKELTYSPGVNIFPSTEVSDRGLLMRSNYFISNSMSGCWYCELCWDELDWLTSVVSHNTREIGVLVEV